MEKKDKYQAFLRDFIFLVKKEIHDLKSKPNEELNDFEIGKLVGKQNLLEILIDYAKSFNISENEIGFNDFEKSNNDG